MSAMVVDSSIACAWVFVDEFTAETEAVLDLLHTGTGIAPAIWPLEVANVLAGAERRGRIARGEAQAALDDLGELPIRVAEPETIETVSDIVRLALDHRLTTYDAAYLALAQRAGVPLATRDGDLAAAARRLGIAVLP